MRFVGIDNGISGSIGVVDNDGFESFMPMFTKKTLDYQKSGSNVTRIHTEQLYLFLKSIIPKDGKCKVVIEAPMVNPQKWKASYSAIRAMEATLVVIEWLKLPYDFISVFEWRKQFLPGIQLKAVRRKNSETKKMDIITLATPLSEIKFVGLQVADKKWPALHDEFQKHGDADGIFIAEAGRQFYSQ